MAACDKQGASHAREPGDVIDAASNIAAATLR
jgi:hypothetical protein